MRLKCANPFVLKQLTYSRQPISIGRCIRCHVVVWIVTIKKNRTVDGNITIDIHNGDKQVDEVWSAT
jgi:hypothetical protein